MKVTSFISATTSCGLPTARTSRAWLVVACVGCADEPRPICIEEYLTIEQGLYGQVLEVSDSGSPPRPTPDWPIEVVVYDPVETVVSFGRTDSIGMYQFDLAAGSYEACTWDRSIAQPCAAFSIELEVLRRFDYTHFFGTGWSDGPARKTTCSD